ncbi:DNA translocase FtsK [Rossellomorea aquimaris]|uniref:DNA translocase FtsK n=1 Tax=Rossellomorea aquimaris TaxID=189382 RepID=UPI003990A5B0
MTYQYPKGNFRFPLISDGEEVKDTRPVRKRREPEQAEQKDRRKSLRNEGMQIDRKSRKSQPEKPVKKESTSTDTVTNDKHKKTKKVEKGNSRPFRPTEIPSPIYGFKARPVKSVKEDEVEFELKEFLHNRAQATEEKVDVYPPDFSEVPKTEEPLIQASLVGNEFSFTKGEEEISDSGPAGRIETSTDSEEGVEEVEVSIESSQETSGVADWREEGDTESSTMEETKDSVLDVQLDSSQKEEQPTLPIGQEKSVEENDASPEIQGVMEYNEQGDTDGDQHQSDSRNEWVENNTESPQEESVESTVLTKEVETSQKEEVDLHQKQDPSEREAPRTRKRSHLPFNVLMLKQDKRQMNQRQRLSGSQTGNAHDRFQGSKPTMQAAKADEHEQSAPTERRESHPPEVKHAPLEPTERKHDLPEKGMTDSSRDHKDMIQGEEAAQSYNALASSVKNKKGYTFPDMEYLVPPVSKKLSSDWLDAQKSLLDETLHNFNVRAKVVNVTQGPSVTRFEVQPEPGVKVNKITNLSDDIKLSLAAKDIRIEAPIPGKHTIGIEVPNKESRPVCISEVIASPAFQESKSALTAALGLDISGQPIVTDLSKMPHGLIAGATGSGKSVCINSILVSLLYKASPDELKLLLIDPKMVELAPYNRIPHLVSPVITDVKAATAALKWAVEEMEKRYELFAHTGVRDIKRFNELAERNKQYSDKLPYLVIVIDELADLMMMSPADVEEAICRIAQKARACGIHLIIATQRPSVDVITGLIKANVPTRVAFSVSSGVDSRTIIDGSGAERLLGKGDMLFLENGSSKPVRLQGTFVSDDEIDEIINHVREQREPDYIFQQDELIKKAQVTEEEDELFLEACEFVIDQGGASASSLQRRFRIGYNRAARLMEMMENSGVISESRGSKPRDVLISESELETLA